MPLQKRSVFHDLMRRRVLPEGSNRKSDRERWIRGSKEPEQVKSLMQNQKEAREQQPKTFNGQTQPGKALIKLPTTWVGYGGDERENETHENA